MAGPIRVSDQSTVTMNTSAPATVKPHPAVRVHTAERVGDRRTRRPPSTRPRTGARPHRTDRAAGHGRAVAVGADPAPGPTARERAHASTHLPGGPVGMRPDDVTRQARVSQRPLETVPADLDSEDGLLPCLRTPAAAVHHPQERRLDPRRSIPLPRGGEIARVDCGLAALRGIRLADGDRDFRAGCTDLGGAVLLWCAARGGLFRQPLVICAAVHRGTKSPTTRPWLPWSNCVHRERGT